MTDAIERDLRRLVRGDVLFDEIHRTLYSTAACIFQIMPRGVVVPKDREDVAAVVRYCHEKGIPITPRGAGSGLAGQTLGEGIILDFTKYMDGLLEVNHVQSWVRVQPGLVLGDLNRALARYGLWFPPDPSSGDVATIGGMIANNAAGAHTVKYGPTRDYVLATEVVLDDGSVATLERSEPTRVFPGRHGRIHAALHELLRKNEALLKRSRPDAPKNSSGYHLWEVIRDGRIDLNRLLVGSEGTLAIVTEAKLKVIRKPAERSLIRFLFDSPEAACEAVLALRPMGPSAVELLDRTILDLVRSQSGEKAETLPAKTKSVLLVEFDGESRDRLLAQAQQAAKSIPALEATVAVGSDIQELWKIRKAASPILDRMKGPLRSTRIIEDVCVNPEKLPQYLKSLRKLFKKHDVEGVIFGHAGSGHIHVNLLMNPDDPVHYEKMGSISKELSGIVLELNGTLSGEHGDGILRAAYLRETAGDLYPIFEQVKKIFDPTGTLNPGKKLAPADFDYRKHLRGSRRPDQTIDAASPFASWQSEIERCNGCGHCRTYCPVHQAIPEESATPRAKANLLMGVLEGRIPLQQAIEGGDFRAVADRCINCKLCLVQCPSLVDIPGMCLEAKALDTRVRDLPRKVMPFVHARSNAKKLARWGGAANFLLGNPVVRWGLRATRGIATGRRFPKVGIDGTNPSTGGKGPDVVYFSGCTADYQDPGGERRALIGILEHNGFRVLAPQGLCCGLPALSFGSRMNARDEAQRVVTSLAGALDAGTPVVVSSSSCATMLHRELPLLLGTARSRRLADSIQDAHTFLLNLHRQGKLATDFKRINATCILHASCHSQAAGTDRAARELLQLIPDLQLLPPTTGCCGMAGAFGIRAETFETSMAIAQPMTDEMRRLNPTFLLTTNGNCRAQLEQGTRRAVLHTLTLLHTAYGFASLQGVHGEHEGLAIQSMVGYMGKSEEGR